MRLFMSSGSWEGWLATVLPSGGPAYPFTAPAVRIKAKPRDDVYLQAAVFSGDPAEFDRLRPTARASDRHDFQLSRWDVGRKL